MYYKCNYYYKLQTCITRQSLLQMQHMKCLFHTHARGICGRLLFGYVCISALKHEHSDTRAYKATSAEKNSEDNDHCIRLPIKFSVNVEDRQDKIPTMYLASLKHIKHDLLPTQAHVLQLNCLNY